jgi:hypothetical protein
MEVMCPAPVIDDEYSRRVDPAIAQGEPEIWPNWGDPRRQAAKIEPSAACLRLLFQQSP